MNMNRQRDTVIEVADLRMRYGTNLVLDAVNLTVSRGEVVTLLGPNGAGKTTTIEILEGLRLPTEGTATVLGVVPSTAPDAWKARVGIVLQSWRDHARWTPRALLAHLGRYYLPYSTPDRQRPYDTEELITMVGLEGQADQKIRTLSGGQRRRLDVAVGIVGRPEILFLDEPTSGFDPHARRDFHDLIHRLADTEETTILLTTHDLDEAEKLADRILILAAGRIVADGSADELARRVTREAEVRWTLNGSTNVHSTPDPTLFVRELLAQNGDISILEVRRATLEDTYIALVQQQEAGHDVEAARRLEATTR